jgi:metal-dependent amidase/aminoacylase/carboxypeptidase family protein
MASCIISRLQLVVSREIDFKKPCVITCGYFHGGTDASIIPEFADFKVDIRSFDKDIQRTAVKATKRITEGECQAANSPKSPRILTSASCTPIDNDEEATAKFTRALRVFYGDEAPGKVVEMDLDITADDFVLLGHPRGEKPIPYVYWNYGVTPRDVYDEAEKRTARFGICPLIITPSLQQRSNHLFERELKGWRLPRLHSSNLEPTSELPGHIQPVVPCSRTVRITTGKHK